MRSERREHISDSGNSGLPYQINRTCIIMYQKTNIAVSDSQDARHNSFDWVSRKQRFPTLAGPQFASREFAEFALTYQFTHHTSSLLYSTSNRKAERTVHNANKFIACDELS